MLNVDDKNIYPSNIQVYVGTIDWYIEEHPVIQK